MTTDTFLVRPTNSTNNSILNVKDYGAIGNGTADDTAAIAAAISALPSGGDVFFPVGTYQVSSAIIMPSNIRLIGTGKNSSIIRKANNIATAMLDFSGASNASRCQRGGLMDLKLDGQGFTGSLVRFKWADHINIDRVWMYNNTGMAVYTENLWDTYFNEVEFDTCSGSSGLLPSVQITSNADDSSNMITFTNCRWENFIDGALWISSRVVVVANTPVVGANPPYGITLCDCKMESPQIKGSIIDMSADVKTLSVDGLYLAARGVFSGGPYILINAIGADDLVFNRVRALFVGAGTVYTLFYVFTNASIGIRDVQIDAVNNPSTAVLNVAGGVPEIDIANLRPSFGQNPTMITGSWPPQVASAAALTIPKVSPLVVITGTTNVTSMTAQMSGRRVMLKFNGALTFTDGSNLKLAGNFVTAADSTIDLVCDGTNWFEMGRSAN